MPPTGDSTGNSTRAAWLPLVLLLAALAGAFVFEDDRGQFYRPVTHDWLSAQTLTLAESFSLARPFLFKRMRRAEDGGIAYHPYNRFPIGGALLVRLAMSPFPGDLSARITAARMLMLVFFSAAAVLAYWALVRITRHRAIALAVTLLVFSSPYMVGYGDAVSTEVSMGLFGVLLVLHGMVLLRDEGRFWQLLAKVCVALLLDWHVYALLGPFLAFGLARAFGRAWRNAAGGAGSVRRFGAAAWRTLRGRECVLGVVALAFGVAVLGYNVMAERSAYAGAPLAELPSVRSMLARLGQDEDYTASLSDSLALPMFLKWQLHRIGTMALPHILPAHPALWSELPRASSGAPLAWVGAVAVAGCFMGLFFARRHRMLLAVLATSGVCWAVLMRHQTALLTHDFESVYYLGVPLVLYTLALLFVARRWGGGPVVAIALLAAVGMVASGMKMSRTGTVAMETEKALLAEFQAIQAQVGGNDVLVAARPDALLRLFPVRIKFFYYMTGIPFNYADGVHKEAQEAGASATPIFVLGLKRVPSRSLLTPNHEHVFLYGSADAADEITDAYRREYRAVTTREPVAQADFDIYLREHLAAAPAGTREREMVFVKAPCARQDTAGRFFVRFFPVDAGVLAGEERTAGFASYAFAFDERGVMFDGVCFATVPLPAYPLATVYAGRWAREVGPAWQTRWIGHDGPFVWQTRFGTKEGVDALRAAMAALAGAPAARGRFDVYWAPDPAVGTGGGTLTYLRKRCDPAEEARFHVHVVPVDRGDLSPAHRRHGFENLDFGLQERGAVVDGACVAVVRLPDWPIARVRTGQHAADGALWQAEFAPEDAEVQGT